MLTAEQQRFWSYFKWDPEQFSHRVAHQFLTSGQARKPQIISAAFSELLDRETDPMTISRVAKTWLTGYRLVFEPEWVERFDEFHRRVRHVVLNEKTLQTVEQY
jgi:hypothetical protein